MRNNLDLFRSLKTELRFLESGGYARVAVTAGREPRIFEDSPSCPNYDNPVEETPCTDCPILALVPPRHRSKAVPCRRIVLNSRGETVESLSELGGAAEAERQLHGWLTKTIQAIENARIRSMPWFPRFDAGTRTFRV